MNPRPVPLTTFSSLALLINMVRKELSLSASGGNFEMWRGGKGCVHERHSRGRSEEKLALCRLRVVHVDTLASYAATKTTEEVLAFFVDLRSLV